ncbi:bifunctional [glutamate--ammonia ligase]-adenylyl-L-tyrosine phosphorylase/[glutamate--ammonia-ligase] adenylyltransferase, partial [bacterium]|nr:bifunctional [glutamate--ammonia ligase]-adenylyl-L-tyrosine phosphorylase/[glutamate--ammonia-ligase] adenylyltransferase [bacterium]
VRQRNTLLALEALEIAGCLTPHETYTLADAYRFLRKTEHRLQLLFDLQTHKLPTGEEALRTLARRMGYAGAVGSEEEGVRGEEPTDSPAGSSVSSPLTPHSSLAPQRRSPLDEAPAPLDTRHLLVDPLDQFLKDLHDKTEIDRAVLNHLLHQSFPDAGTGAEPESDLILDPGPDDATVRAVLGRYPFRDVPKAYQNLLGLARESVPFLSDRRCRHFLASIAPRLLSTVADTPDPDEALTQLERVSASLGAKAVLWELFSANPATLRLYVDLCAGSPFLSGILINNPGMADELLDSLVLNQPRAADDLRAELAELCRGASDPDPILHSFQDKELLRVGVADLLGMADVRATTAALSDLADTLLNQMCELVEAEIKQKHEIRNPYPDPAAGSSFEFRVSNFPAHYCLLGLGKLGGREISYHSDLDLVLVYEADGRDAVAAAGPYFTELAQRLIKAASTHGPMGRLYAVDMRLRPTGKSGSLVLPLGEFDRYYAGGGAQLWERQALTRARVVRGDAAFGARVMAHVRAAATGAGWAPAAADEVRRMREKLEAGTTARNLKRGAGGLIDVEFAVQLLQLKYGTAYPAVLEPNVWAALDALEASALLPAAEAAALRAGYSFLRLVEARLRVVTDRPLTELPESADDLSKLARRLGFESAAAFLAEHRRVTGDIRRVYTAVTTRERG